MKKRIFASSLVLLMLLAGCTGEPATETVNPYSAVASQETPSYEDTASLGDITYEKYTGNPNFLDELEEETTPSRVEKNAATSTLDTKWDAVRTSSFTGGAEAEAAALRNKILSTGNTADYYSWTGKTIYVSPDGNNENDGLTPKTAVLDLRADVFYENPLEPGDAVLFERGGLWRMLSSISTEEGVIYGSYGTGEKPTFYGSARNYADEDQWRPSNKEHVWKLSVADMDIGLIVFNNGEYVGYKRLNGITALDKNLDYYYSTKDDCLYLYYDGGNPGKAFKSIEVCFNKSGFTVSDDNVTLDNLRIKYYGRFGISMAGNNNTNITNCEIGFIGGALQDADTGLRYGNGIQQWNSIDGLKIENCWVYQTYDAGITWQGDDDYQPGTDPDGNERIDDKAYYKNIYFVDNLLEYNCMDFETWHDSRYYSTPTTLTSRGNTTAKMENHITTGNICRYTGYGWSAIQRPDFIGWCFGRGGHNFVNSSNLLVSNNIFDCAARALVYWRLDVTVPGFNISGNTFYQHSNRNNEAMQLKSDATSASDQGGLESAIAQFDPAPKKVQWIK